MIQLMLDVIWLHRKHNLISIKLQLVQYQQERSTLRKHPTNKILQPPLRTPPEPLLMTTHRPAGWEMFAAILQNSTSLISF